MKRTTLFTVILYGLCAAVWTVKTALGIACHTYDDSSFWPVLDALCAVIWICAFFANLRRYRAHRED